MKPRSRRRGRHLRLATSSPAATRRLPHHRVTSLRPAATRHRRLAAIRLRHQATSLRAAYPPPPGYQPPGYPQPESAWQLPPAYPLAPDAYPVNISYDRLARINRLWGIPILGILVRTILLIPHFILMFLVAIVAALLMLVTWLPVLLLGRFPGWGYRWIGGLMGWYIRVQAYLELLTPTYPPFSLSGEEHPVTVRFDEGVRINRLWGIPLIGMWVRFFILIPHYIVLWLLNILAAILLWFTWVPVLFMGRQADLIYTVVGGYNRWCSGSWPTSS